MPIALKRFVLVLAAASALAAPARAADKAPAEPDQPLDVGDAKAKLKLSDGKGHYLWLVPFGDTDSPTLYSGDGGKNFYAQRVYGGGSSGDGRKPEDNFDRVFWDPRAHAPYKASFGYRDQKYTVQCEERITELKPVADADATKIAAAAKLWKPRWKHRAYALARDNTGRYYYVDVGRDDDSKQFRLYAGTKGSLKLQKMTNVVSDSAGDIFATKSGSLRLILNKGESLWEQSGKKEKLVLLPVDDNHVLIYTDLGVYTGLPLGTPCDDL